MRRFLALMLIGLAAAIFVAVQALLPSHAPVPLQPVELQTPGDDSPAAARTKPRPKIAGDDGRRPGRGGLRGPVDHEPPGDGRNDEAPGDDGAATTDPASALQSAPVVDDDATAPSRAGGGSTPLPPTDDGGVEDDGDENSD